MTRSELIAKLCEQNPQLTLHEIERLIDTIFGSVEAALTSGLRIELRDFGVFTTRERKARSGRNPRTGKIVDVAPKRQPFFKTGLALQKRLNKAPPPRKPNRRKPRPTSPPDDSKASSRPERIAGS